MTTPRQLLGNVTLAFALLLIAGAALPAEAQLTDVRWQPWLGCWEAIGEPDDAPVLCLAPRSGESGIDMITLIDERVVSRETILADGQGRGVTREGCEGLERTEFSNDSHRIFFNSELICQGDVTRKSSGVMSMTTPYEWLDVRAVEVEGQSVPWVLRYRLASRADFEAAGLGDLPEGGAVVMAARIAASSALTLDQVIEASSKMDSKAVEAWIAESGAPFALDASWLIRMADAGVADGVIDVMVALSYPDEFVVNTGAAGGERVRAEQGSREARRGSYGSGFYDPFYDPYLRYGYYPGFGYGGYGGYVGIGRYGYGMTYGGYGGYGMGYGYGGYSVYRPGVVVVGRQSAGGRAVAGRGYTRSGRGSAGGVIPRGSSVRSSGGAAARSAPQAGASSSGGGRKAKRRSPG